MRINKYDKHIPQIKRGNAILMEIDGKSVTAFEGETVASVLMAEGMRSFRLSSKNAEPRGMFCGIGICQECRVTVNGVANVRACMTSVAQGMVVETGRKVQ